jgi:hypothetical protein
MHLPTTQELGWSSPRFHRCLCPDLSIKMYAAHVADLTQCGSIVIALAFLETLYYYCARKIVSRPVGRSTTNLILYSRLRFQRGTNTSTEKVPDFVATALLQFPLAMPCVADTNRSVHVRVGPKLFYTDNLNLLGSSST